MAAQTTSGLSAEVQTYYYVRKFLPMAEMQFIHGQGAQKRTQSAGEGASLRFTRLSPLAVATTPLTQGVNPAEVNLAEANVDVTLAEYGNTVKIAKFLSVVTIDRGNAEKIANLGENMGRTLDTLMREIMFSGATVQIANGKAGIANLLVTDVITTVEMRKALRRLELNNALPYEDGMFMGKLGPNTKFDFTGDSLWTNAKSYSDPKDLYKGEMGSWSQFRLISANNQKSEASTVTVYSNFFHGRDAIGEYDLEQDKPTLKIKIPGEQSTDNPGDRFSTIAWVGSWAGKVLNADWIVNVKAGATA